MPAFFFMPHIGLLPKIYTNPNAFDLLKKDGMYTSYVRYQQSYDCPTPEAFTQQLELNYPDIEQILAEGEQIITENNLDGTPVFSIQESILTDQERLFDSGQMSEDDKAYWTMYWAIGSKIGVKRYASTTKAEILSRMFGASTEAELTATLQGDPYLAALHKRFSGRYFYERTLMRLQADHRIVEYGAFRRTFVALYKRGMTSPMHLANLVNEHEAAARKQVIQREKEEARERYRQRSAKSA